MVIVLTFARFGFPAKDQVCVTKRPATMVLCVQTTTPVGPAHHFPVPRIKSLAVGMNRDGPRPIIHSPMGAGTRKSEGFISPMPLASPAFVKEWAVEDKKE